MSLIIARRLCSTEAIAAVRNVFVYDFIGSKAQRSTISINFLRRPLCFHLHPAPSFLLKGTDFELI